MTSCCKSSNKSMTQRQFEEMIARVPEVPKKEYFNKEEQTRIANLPPLFKQWVYEMVLLTKCAKEGKCG